MKPVVKKAITWTIGLVIVASSPFIRSFEGRYNTAYPDPASPMGKSLRSDGVWNRVLNGLEVPSKYDHLDGSPWTICDGITKGVRRGDKKTDKECDALLEQEISYHHRIMRSCVKVPLTLWQEAAMTSFFYNLGSKACDYRVIKRINEGAPPEEWCELIKLYDYAGGQVLRGLTRRRQAERDLCLGESPWRISPTTLLTFEVE